MNWAAGNYQANDPAARQYNQQDYAPAYSYSQTNQPAAASSAADQWWQSRQANYAPSYSRSQLQNQPQAVYDATAVQQWQNRQNTAPTYSYSQTNQPAAAYEANQQWQNRPSYTTSTYTYTQSQPQGTYEASQQWQSQPNYQYTYRQAQPQYAAPMIPGPRYPQGTMNNYNEYYNQPASATYGCQGAISPMQPEQNIQDNNLSDTNEMDTSAELGHEASDGSGEMEG